MATIAEALALALRHHQAGNLPQAEQLYRQILQADPSHAESCHLLGMLALQLETDSIDASHLPALSEGRLKLFNTALADQLSATKAELKQVILDFRIDQLDAERRLHPEKLAQVVWQNGNRLRAGLESLERGLEILENPIAKAWLKRQTYLVQSDREIDFQLV